MTTESLLVKTKDNYVVVLSLSFSNAAEKMRRIKQCEQYCQNVDYNDLNVANLSTLGAVYDKPNTEFLRAEISGYHYKKQPQNFINELKTNNFPQNINKPNVLHFNNCLSDDFFPEMIKNVGCRIKPKDEIFKVQYNTHTGEYEIRDFKIRRAEVNTDKKEITIVRNHFEFAPHDFAHLQKLMADYEKVKQNNPYLDLADYTYKIQNSKDRSLFKIYAIEQLAVSHLEAFMDHELKHIKNSIFLSGLRLKDDYKRLSVENMYRINVEDERSAYLQQLISSLNQYLKKGDYNDFSMFDAESAPFANHLKTLKSKEDRLKYATNWPVLVNEMMKQFDSKHKKHYDDKQFAGNTCYTATTEPAAAAEDDNNETFKKIRSLYYQYVVYNPLTGKDENVNLSKYILPEHEVEISDENQTKIINPAAIKLQQRRDEIKKRLANGEINTDLVAPAKKLMRDAAKSSAFINEIDGISVGRLFDEQNGGGVSNGPTTKIPDDKASWSDDLQKYWSKTSGYKEIAKNNYEYSFKINDAQIRYSDKTHVNISSNADFELYMKVLHEPNSKDNVVKFADTLSKEQALILYIACTNCGRKMIGNVPTDLSGIKNLKGIPPEEMNKFNHRVSSVAPSTQRANYLPLQRGFNRGR